jgi:hypothetical protein
MTRFSFLIRALTAAVALVALAPAASAVSLTLAPSSTTVSVGDAFTVDVYVDEVLDQDLLLAFGFDVLTGAGLSYQSAAVGAAFFDDSAFFPETSVAGSAFPGLSGDGIHLATLSFLANGVAGQHLLSLGTDASNFGFVEGLFTEFSVLEIAASLSIMVNDVTVPPVSVPSPAGGWLMALAMMELARRRRRAVRDRNAPIDEVSIRFT